MQLAFFVNILPRDYQLTSSEGLASVKAISDSSVFSHTLVTVGGGTIDPFVAAQYLADKIESFRPIIAVNTTFSHPLDVSRKLADLIKLYGDRFSLNLVTGSVELEFRERRLEMAFKERSERLVEFYRVTRQLFSEEAPFNFKGRYFDLDGVRPVTAKSFKLFVSGHHKEKCITEDPDVCYVRQLRPNCYGERISSVNEGVGLGVFVRETEREAERDFPNVFPENRQGQMMFRLGLREQNSPWSQWLSEYLKTHRDTPDYNLRPLLNGYALTPYLVGSFDVVEEKMRLLMSNGFRFFILHFPPSEFAPVRQLIERLKR